MRNAASRARRWQGLSAHLSLSLSHSPRLSDSSASASLHGSLDATTQTIAWCVIFFFASAGASAAYLTVSEIFPMETRAMAIAFFYATGTIVGGFGGPLLFGALIESGEPDQIFVGYVVGALVMIGGGIVQATMGVEAAQRDLEDIAPPLSMQAAELDEPGEESDPYTLGRGEGRGTEHAPGTRPGGER